MRRSGSGSSLGLTLSASNFGPALPVIQDYSPPGLLGARGMYMIRPHFSTLSIIFTYPFPLGPCCVSLARLLARFPLTD